MRQPVKAEKTFTVKRTARWGKGRLKPTWTAGRISEGETLVGQTGQWAAAYICCFTGGLHADVQRLTSNCNRWV